MMLLNISLAKVMQLRNCERLFEFIKLMTVAVKHEHG